MPNLQFYSPIGGLLAPEGSVFGPLSDVALQICDAFFLQDVLFRAGEHLRGAVKESQHLAKTNRTFEFFL
jgi:hypothetical protein